MDDIFKKSHNIVDVVPNSLHEPHRYDNHGNLKPEYMDEIRYASQFEDKDDREHVAHDELAPPSS